jgi:hypothetical protein
VSLRVTSVAGIGLLAVVLGHPVRAQSAGELLVAARAHLERLNVDSAAALLARVRDPSLRASPGQRAVASVLSGAGALILGQEASARAAFRDALVIDPLLRVDSLASLHSDLVRVFEAARAGPATLVVALPPDTVLDADSGELRIGVRTSRRVLVTASVSLGASAEPPVYQDSQLVAGVDVFSWRPGASTPIPTGTLTLRVTVREPVTDPAAFAATLRVERVAVDTASPPPALASTALLPETTRVRVRRPRSLLTGIAFGVAAATLAEMGAQGPAGRDGRALIVAGALSIGGVVGFLSGGYANRPIPENVARNRERQATIDAARDSVASANARRRAAAGVRVVVTRGSR